MCFYGPKCFFDHPVELVEAAVAKRMKQSPEESRPHANHANSAKPATQSERQLRPAADAVTSIATNSLAVVDMATASQQPLLGEPITSFDESGAGPSIAGPPADPQSGTTGMSPRAIAAESKGGYAFKALLDTVNTLWPPVSQAKPEPWTLSQVSKMLLIRAAWRAWKASSAVSAGAGGEASATPPKGLAATLALGSLSGLGAVCVTGVQLREEAVLLAQVGAELGLCWRKKQVWFPLGMRLHSRCCGNP
jgi:hypothetical protein